MSCLVPGEAIIGNLSSSLNEWITNCSSIRMFIPCSADVRTYIRNMLRDVSSSVAIDKYLGEIKWSTAVDVACRFSREFQPLGMEWLSKPRFEVASRPLCIYCWYEASSECLVGEDFMGARVGSEDRELQPFWEELMRFPPSISPCRSKPWFEVTSKTHFRYAWYVAWFEYGVKDAVGALKLLIFEAFHIPSL